MENNSAQNLNPENNVLQASQTPPVSPPQTQPPITKASKFSIKAIFGTIIFLLLAGGAAAGYVYREPLLKLVAKPTPTPAPIVTMTPTPDPTADWKTYENNTYQYSIKYPSNANLIEEDKENVWINDLIWISIKKTPTIASGPIGDGPNYNGPTTKLKIDGIETEKSSGEIGEIGGNIPQEFQEVLISKNGFDYTLKLYAVPQFENPKYTSTIKLTEDKTLLFDQILSTFKFTD